MDLAISKAKETGCAWVTATGVRSIKTLGRCRDKLSVILAGSNHYGIAGHYTLRAVEQGLIVSST